MHHIRHGKYARAFHMPETWLAKIRLLMRGWRPYGYGELWAKPNKAQAIHDAQLISGIDWSIE